MNIANRLKLRSSAADKPDTCAHLIPQLTPPNQLLDQVLSDSNLDSALAWLRTHSQDQDHSDVWAYSRDWRQHKLALQRQVRRGQFTFQTVREVESKDSLGQSQWQELRCAQDRLLIRALSQILGDVLAQGIAPECVDLAGRGGSQGAVQASYQQLQAQPQAQIMKSDVKGYYAHIDHVIVHQQFCTLLPNESELQRLLWLFLRRTVERGGNYRNIERGIPFATSLSEQLGSLYLSPLDALFSGPKQPFYRRYRDDWVIFCKHSWQSIFQLTNESEIGNSPY